MIRDMSKLISARSLSENVERFDEPSSRLSSRWSLSSDSNGVERCRLNHRPGEDVLRCARVWTLLIPNLSV
jgi:hypothetical protein